jgi:hypothetical protein
MKNNANLKIFLVEFGKPDLSHFIGFGNNQDYVFVIAETYDDAAQKALLFAENNTRKSESIIDIDGSLRLQESTCLQVKSIKIVANEIIM